MKTLLVAALTLGLAVPALAQSDRPLTGSPQPSPGTNDGAVVDRGPNRAPACVPPTATGGANATVTDPCKGVPDARTDNHTVPTSPTGPGAKRP